MPAPIEVTDPVAVVRELHDDEKLVVKDFERHASHCTNCTDAVQTLTDGRTLCESGNTRARTVSTYLFSRNGKHFSTVDYESGQSVRVKLPRDAYAVRNLLTALEQGLRLPEKPVIVQPVQPVQPVDTVSYDQTYPVTPRQVAGKQSRPRSLSPDTYQLVERAPRSSRSPTSIMYRSPGGSPSRPTSSRGSLYSVDHQERRYESTRRYVEASPKYHR